VIFLIATAKVFFRKKAAAIKNITIAFSMKNYLFDFFRKGVHHEFIFKITFFTLKSLK
jgi:hypothetical protein